jgi:hypothetical protein
MKERLKVPVLSAGRILDLDQAEAALEAGDCDLLAMTRAIIADPDLPNKALEGQSARIRPCIAINEGCIGRDYQGLPMLCAVNPAVAWPELDDYGRAEKSEQVVVVGGGPAGMEAARVAAERGHRVLLMERAQRLGGQLATAARAPERPHLGRHLAWLERELGRLGVGVRLGVEASAETILGSEPDVVVVATGAENGLPPETAGVQSRCVTDVDLLEGREKVEPGQRVLVYDPEGLNRGGSIADLAAEAGASVELATPLLAVCQDLDPTQQPAMMRRLARNGVVTSPNQLLQPQEGGKLVLRHAWSDAERAVDADLLVFVGYRRAVSGLEDVLEAARPDLEVRMVGDCVAPRRLHDAVAEGVRAGRAIGDDGRLPAADAQQGGLGGGLRDSSHRSAAR